MQKVKVRTLTFCYNFIATQFVIIFIILALLTGFAKPLTFRDISLIHSCLVVIGGFWSVHIVVSTPQANSAITIGT